jgi:hypothetical protein
LIAAWVAAGSGLGRAAQAANERPSDRRKARSISNDSFAIAAVAGTVAAAGAGAGAPAAAKHAPAERQERPRRPTSLRESAILDKKGKFRC